MDSIIGYEILSFIDGFSGYNHIKINLDGKHKTTFTTLWGILCWLVLPFDLKNVGATYQRAMVTMFYDLIHNYIEIYVDNILAKSKKNNDTIGGFEGYL